MSALLFAGALLAAVSAEIRPGADWRNDMAYAADRQTYDLRESDTVLVNDVRCHHLGYDRPLKTAFFLKGLSNVSLDFKGATVLLHGCLQPFVIEDCTNVTIRNVTVKYARSPFTEGEVVAKADDVLKLKVDKSLFPYEVRDGDCYFMGDGLPAHPSLSSSFAKFYDAKTRENHHTRLVALGRHAKLNPNAPWTKSVRVLEASEEGGLLVFRCARSFADWPVRTGDRMVMGHEGRSLSNCMMVDSCDVRLVNYRILNGYGMGIFPFHCHNLTIEGLRLTQDAESPSIVANLADGIHAFACSGDFIVRDSVIEGTIDDALNVHANFFKVKSASGDRIVADTGLEPYSTTALFLPGDRIRVYRGFTLDPAADYTIAATKPIDKKTVEFTVDRPVAAHQALDAIENLSTQCKLTVSNCRFGRSTAHLRFQTRGGVLVENCESSLMFMLTGDMSYWFESSPCERAVFRNVRFKGPRGKFWIDPQFVPSEKAPYYHGDLVLENCTFEAEKAIGAHYVKSVTLKNCRRTDGGRLKLDLVNCGTVSAPGCDVESRKEKPTALKAN